MDFNLLEIEAQIEQLKKEVEFGKLIEKLQRNSEFKKVVIDDYFEKEAIRLVHAKADQTMQSEAKQKYLDDAMKGISAFSDYLRTKLTIARQAADQLVSAEDLRADLLEGDEYE